MLQGNSSEPSEMDVDPPSGSNESQRSYIDLTSETAAPVEDQATQENGTTESASLEPEQMAIDEIRTDHEPPSAAAASPDPVQENATEPQNVHTTISATDGSSNDVLITGAGERKRASSPSQDAPTKKSKTETSMSDQEKTATVLNSTNDSTPQLDSTSTSNEYSGAATLEANKVMTGYESMESSIATLIQDKLEPIKEVVPLQPLSLRDLAELENSLQLGDKYEFSEDDAWKKDWSGNLQLYEKNVVVNQGYVMKHQGHGMKPIMLPFHEYVVKSSADNKGLRGLELLLSYVYHTQGCPQMAQRILADALGKPADTTQKRIDFIIDAIRRTTYDPLVLEQDGWTTKKAETPEGSMGGAHLIGRRVIWDRHEAVVIAFTLDETWGSLWKAIYVEDLETFDMEADEIQQGLTKYEKKQARLQKKNDSTKATAGGATRKQAIARFLVDGIEHGIVMALPSKGSSKGVMWPARIMHVSEMSSSYGGGRRNMGPTKAQVQVVFLAPFWNGNASSVSGAGAVDPFSLGPCFEIDTIEVSDVTITKYPHEKFSIDDFKSGFSFLGLPQAVLSRYLDANRIAMALKTYARKYIPKSHNPGDEDAFASASLTGSHAMSVLAPLFPSEVLSIPFEYILKQLPRANEHVSVLDGDDTSSETVVDIKTIVDSMTPPLCFGKKQLAQGTSLALSPERSQKAKLIMSPNPTFTPRSQDSEVVEEEIDIWSINNFASEMLLELLEKSQSSGNHFLSNLAQSLNSLLMQLKELVDQFYEHDSSKQKKELSRMLKQCLLVKGYGEDILASTPIPTDFSSKIITTEWRKACERVYKRGMQKLKLRGAGNGHTVVISDSRCNGHITAENAYERPVRLPAAIKGARLAGAGSEPNVSLVNSVEDAYVSLAEDKIIPKAHQRTYVKRLKATIAAIPDDQTGVQLTDNSEDEGGDDTKGSRGSYTAATVGVAAALMAVDQVIGGQVVNAFCATRPPGHHAGRELHPMRAVSNGFCLFNAAACAAIYATTPHAQGGLGLRRVCVIDFDLHHGNGTQDILCNTHDPRFLYVSWHVGGAHINGYEEEHTFDQNFHLPGSKTTEGIFPGRCGDTSPHDGVLNIPLGNKVTSTDVGTALVSQVLPRVESFSPDLIILSAGFDAHANDPLGMGRLTASDFSHITDVACKIAHKICSGRIMSVLEGGYGVPCCAPRTDIFLPSNEPERLLDLGDDLPADMPDPVTNALLRQKLNKCHAEGFIDCVREHVRSFVNNNKRK